MRDIDTVRITEQFYRRLQEEKKKKSRKPLTAALVVTALVIAGTMTIWGQDIVQAIRTYIAGGNINYFIVDEIKLPVPDELMGLLFDADGNELAFYSPGEDNYTANGEKAFFYQNKDGGLTVGSKEEYDARMAEVFVTFRNLDEALQYFIGDVHIPDYMPEGFWFGFVSFYDYHGTLYTDGNDYMLVTYLNSSSMISFSVKNMGDVGAVGYYTKDDGSFDSEPVEMLINGHKTTIIGRRLHIEIDNIMYIFSATDDISIEELIMVAESM